MKTDHYLFSLKSAMIKIYHNPNCGTSRKTLEFLREHHIDFETIFYLETPANQSELRLLLKEMGMGVRDLLRQKGTPYDELDLGNARWSDDELLDFMAQYPILMNRPVVVTPKGTRLCRPMETVLEILDLPKSP
jgi:arsenate reductase